MEKQFEPIFNVELNKIKFHSYNCDTIAKLTLVQLSSREDKKFKNF